jgi:pachytene checkpoint protein 2
MNLYLQLFILSDNFFSDTAFVDRADIVQYIDLPSFDAVYEILRTCLCEIILKGIIASIVRAYMYHLNAKNDTKI